MADTDEQLRLILTSVAKKLKDEPQADLKQLVDYLKAVLSENSLLASAASRMIQINQNDAKSFQTLVEGGTVLVGEHYHVDKCTLKAVLETFITEQKPTPIGIPQNIPLSGTPEFVGRDNELDELHKKLQQAAAQPTIAALAGMGGLGKSELAIQYARKYLNVYPSGICWVFAGEFEVGPQIVKFAEAQLGLKIPEGLDLPEQISFCWRHWQAGEVLFVFDDVTDFPKLKPYLPPDLRFKVLLTTRLQLGAPVRSLTLKVLTKQASLNLLSSEFLVGEDRITAEQSIAQSLCEWLGYLPLGLELVGRYLKDDEDLLLSMMLSRLQAKALEDESMKRDPNDPTWSLTAQLGVAAAFKLSWEKLKADSQRLGCLLSLFALAPIPWRLVVSVEQHRCDLFFENEEFHPEKLNTSRKELIRFHLLQRVEQEVYLLHSLIREFLRDKQNNLATAFEQKYNFCQVIVGVAEEIPDSPTQEIISSLEDAIRHFVEVAQNLTDAISDESLIPFFVKLGKFYKAQGFYAMVQPLYNQCKLVVESRFGEENSNYAISLNNLANIYEFQGHYNEAEKFYRQALELDERTRREENSNYAISLSGLANIYYSQGRYKEAEPLCEKARELTKRLLGEEHPDYATSLSRLANLYLSQGRYNEAEKFYTQARELTKKLLGEEHPDYATSLSGLANLYISQGRYEEAEPLCQKALELRKEILGEKHPDVATSLNSLANIYCFQRYYKKAKQLYEQALELRKEKLGEKHDYVATSLSGLAKIYCSQRHYKKAEKLYNEALEIRRKMLGEEHPDVATSLSGLAELYISQERYEEAEKLYNEALEIRRKVLGEEHPDVATSLSGLAELYISQERYEEAEKLYNEALEIRRKVLGEEHHNTVNVRKRLESLRDKISKS